MSFWFADVVVEAVEVPVWPGAGPVAVVVPWALLAVVPAVGALVAGVLAVVAAPLGAVLAGAVLVAAVVGVSAAAAVVTVRVVAGALAEPLARLTSAAASTPSDSAITAASVAVEPLPAGRRGKACACRRAAAQAPLLVGM